MINMIKIYVATNGYIIVLNTTRSLYEWSILDLTRELLR